MVPETSDPWAGESEPVAWAAGELEPSIEGDAETCWDVGAAEPPQLVVAIAIAATRATIRRPWELIACPRSIGLNSCTLKRLVGQAVYRFVRGSNNCKRQPCTAAYHEAIVTRRSAARSGGH